MKTFYGNSLIGKFIFLSILGIYVIISFWLFCPYNPMEINTPIKILNLNNKVMAGENLVYILEMDKKLPLPATISKQLLNDVVITYTPVISNVPTGKYSKQFILPIPKYAPAGLYKFKWQGDYKVNPIRTINVISVSETFEVIAGDSEQ